jgi:hypothetical protein
MELVKKTVAEFFFFFFLDERGYDAQTCNVISVPVTEKRAIPVTGCGDP